ncbi:MAG TPA: VOC family protein [Anaerolineaceae bacterium]|nr:VOC family protein [Anaerolineaceae bacterium]
MKDFYLPAETQIAYANLIVASMTRALSFYKDKLGLQVIHRQNGTAILSSSQSQPSALILTEDREAEPKPPSTTGLYHVAIRFPNRAGLGRALQGLIQQGWRFIGAADHGVSEAIYTVDPDGNGLELYADKPRSVWPRKNGQIAMVSDPLDLNNLLNSAGDVRENAHPGIGVGHIHLQVGDLDRSRAFYRDLLGLEVTQEDFHGALFLAAGKYHHHIGLNIWAGKGAPRPPANSVGLKSFGLRVPDRTSRNLLADRVREAGLPVEEKQDPLSSQKSLLFHDPDGNGVELLI